MAKIQLFSWLVCVLRVGGLKSTVQSQPIRTRLNPPIELAASTIATTERWTKPTEIIERIAIARASSTTNIVKFIQPNQMAIKSGRNKNFLCNVSDAPAEVAGSG